MDINDIFRWIIGILFLSIFLLMLVACIFGWGYKIGQWDALQGKNHWSTNIITTTDTNYSYEYK